MFQMQLFLFLKVKFTITIKIEIEPAANYYQMMYFCFAIHVFKQVYLVLVFKCACGVFTFWGLSIANIEDDRLRKSLNTYSYIFRQMEIMMMNKHILHFFTLFAFTLRHQICTSFNNISYTRYSRISHMKQDGLVIES